MVLIRGGFLSEYPIPRKKIPIPGIKNPRNIPKVQNPKTRGFCENPGDKSPEIKKNPEFRDFLEVLKSRSPGFWDFRDFFGIFKSRSPGFRDFSI